MSASHANGPLTHTFRHPASWAFPTGNDHSLAYRESLDPDYILYSLLSGSSDARQDRLRSKRPFVPAALNLLNNLVGLGIRFSKWNNYRWNAEYCENTSRLRVFILKTSAKPFGMSLPRTAWVKLNYLQIGVDRFHSSMHKWSLSPSPNYDCGAPEQTANRVLITCPIHRAPHGTRGLTVLDDKTRCWLNNITASIWSGTVAYAEICEGGVLEPKTRLF